MASVFGHALAALAAGSTLGKRLRSGKLLALGALCAILPDADVLAFRFGIAYESFWGHRGFTHSLLFAGLWGTACALLLFRRGGWKDAAARALYLAACTASHGLLDAMTSGGKGVAFFSPWDNARYFLPWRPIKVSPIGLRDFLGEWGARVLASELLWIGLPCLLWMLLLWGWRRGVRHGGAKP
jgi:inner membrane protein